MKKRIVSMILALSMVLSILPVSAFADAGTSAAAAETTAAGTNEETTNSVVTIKIGADGLPEEQSGPGWELRQLQQLAGHCRRSKCKDRVYSGWR